MPIALGIIIAFSIAKADGYWESWLNFPSNPMFISSKQFTTFFESFRYAFYVAGSSLPISGLYAAIFRSKQTAEQMQLTEEHNILNNHFKHLSEFRSSVSSNLTLKNFWPSTESLYNIIFPYSKTGDFHFSSKFYNIENIIRNISETENHPYETYRLALDLKERIQTQLNIQNQELALSEIQSLLNGLNDAISFSGTNNRPFILSKIFTESLEMAISIENSPNNTINFDRHVRIKSNEGTIESNKLVAVFMKILASERENSISIYTSRLDVLDRNKMIRLLNENITNSNHILEKYSLKEKFYKAFRELENDHIKEYNAKYCFSQTK